MSEFSLHRERVNDSFKAAESDFRVRRIKDPSLGQEYIYENQIIDAHNIIDLLYSGKRIVSVIKKTKVGADGLMLSIGRLKCTHPDDKFMSETEGIKILTGMSNKDWENDMINNSPSCFKTNITHHGQLNKINLKNWHDCCIIIDEIDTGDKEGQKLHGILEESGILDIDFMIKNNIYLVVISATIIKHLYELYRWGDLHCSYKMTIPDEYIGHIEFLERGLIKEFYKLNTSDSCEKWIETDIIKNYGSDYRVHIVRSNKKNQDKIESACIKHKILFMNHTADDRLSDEDKDKLFIKPLTTHIVVCVKNLFRRANLIPNNWKLRIGCVHELHCDKVDNNVQIQGLVGRMTGYWKTKIVEGHKTGPYRTSIKSIEEYEKSYNNPFDLTLTYSSADFRLSDSKQPKFGKSSFLSVENIKNMNSNQEYSIQRPWTRPIIKIQNIYPNKSTEYIRKEMNSYISENHSGYFNYEIHVWIMDTDDKRSKWGYENMIKDNACSTSTNIVNKRKNVLMIYIDHEYIFMSPWNGDEYNKAYPENAAAEE